MRHTNIIAIKDVIISKKVREKKRQSVVGNVINQTEVTKISSPIDLNSKNMWAISNADMDATRDLRLTSMKKYLRRAGQINKEVNGLHRDWILALVAFVKHTLSGEYFIWICIC